MAEIRLFALTYYDCDHLFEEGCRDAWHDAITREEILELLYAIEESTLREETSPGSVVLAQLDARNKLRVMLGETDRGLE